MTNTEAQAISYLISTFKIDGKRCYKRNEESELDTLKRLLFDYENSVKLTKLLLKQRYWKVGDEVMLIEVPQNIDFNNIAPDIYPLTKNEKGYISYIAPTGIVIKVSWNNEKCKIYNDRTFMISEFRKLS